MENEETKVPETTKKKGRLSFLFILLAFLLLILSAFVIIFKSKLLTNFKKVPGIKNHVITVEKFKSEDEFKNYISLYAICQEFF